MPSVSRSLGCSRGFSNKIWQATFFKSWIRSQQSFYSAHRLSLPIAAQRALEWHSPRVCPRLKKWQKWKRYGKKWQSLTQCIVHFSDCATVFMLHTSPSRTLHFHTNQSNIAWVRKTFVLPCPATLQKIDANHAEMITSLGPRQPSCICNQFIMIQTCLTRTSVYIMNRCLIWTVSPDKQSHLLHKCNPS